MAKEQKSTAAPKSIKIRHARLRNTTTTTSVGKVKLNEDGEADVTPDAARHLVIHCGGNFSTVDPEHMNMLQELDQKAQKKRRVEKTANVENGNDEDAPPPARPVRDEIPQPEVEGFDDPDEPPKLRKAAALRKDEEADDDDDDDNDSQDPDDTAKHKYTKEELAEGSDDEGSDSDDEDDDEDDEEVPEEEDDVDETPEEKSSKKSKKKGKKGKKSRR